MKTGWRLLPLALGGLAVILAACGKNGSSPATLFQWQDYTAPAFYAEYEKAFGEKPATTIFADEDEAFSKMRAGFKPDVMGPCLYSLPRWKEAGLLAPIDTSKLKNWNKLTAAQEGVVAELLAAKGESLAVDQPILSFA